jgi:hypothetical protein
MYPENTTPPTAPIAPAPRSHKKLIILIVSIVVVLAIGVGTFLILRSAKQPTEEKVTPVTELNEVAAPDVLVASYVDTAIADRAELYEQRKAVDSESDGEVAYENSPQAATAATNGTIPYQAAGSYKTRVSTMDYVQFARKDAGMTDNSTELASATDTFLTGKGLTKVGEDTSLSGITYVNYDSKNVFCQVSDFKKTPTNPASYGLACVFKSVITSQYSFMNDLMKLLPAEEAKTTPESLIPTPAIIDGEMQLVTLTATYGSEGTLLIFANDGDAWEYVGKRPVPNPDDEESFVISDELQAAINDPKWDGFLAKYIK